MHTTHNRSYVKLVFMSVLSFIAMYILMYAMVNTSTNIYTNLNQLYMAGLMTMPMVVIEIMVMKSMYENRQINIIIILISIVFLIIFYLLIRNQTAISNKQFLRSMVPHHAAAILMCEQAPLQDKQIIELCDTIKSNQQSEIDWMKNKLNSL